MADDIIKGQWKQIKGEAKQWWGELTDDDLDRVEGRREELVGILQERYGWEKQKANAEIDRRLEEYRTRTY